MRTPIPLMLLAAALVACGDDESGGPTAATKPAATAAPAKRSLPPELVGTWTMKLAVSELPERPNELNEASARWELKILADGGVDGAPSLTVLNGNDEVGAIFSPPAVAVSRDRLKVADPTEDCNGAPASLEFAFAVEGDRMTLRPAGTPDCPSELMEAILTTNAWERAQ